MAPPDEATLREWLVGGGELGELIRAKDWSSTPLGARERWPQSLRTAVGLVVEGGVPTALLWGPQAVLLYNDAYREVAADRHPVALGHPSREGWEAFSALDGPGVLEDQPISVKRGGRVEVAHFKLRRCPVRLEGGTAGGVLVTFEEKTETRRSDAALRDAKDFLQRLVDSWPGMVFAKDERGRVVFVNRFTAEYYGTTPEQLISHSTKEVHTRAAEAEAFIEDDERVIREGLSIEREELNTAPDGQQRWFNTIKVPLRRADGSVHVLGISTDITERRQIQEALRSAHVRLVESDQRKNEFLAVLSHELRNPLAPIRTSLFVLERAAPGSEQALRALATIARQVAHLTRLVDELLDVTRIARGRVELSREWLDLNELAAQAVDDHRAMCAASGLTLTLSPARAPAGVRGDRVRLAQAIGNLLQNAAKFTPRGGTIAVALQADAGGKQVVLDVRDSGVGIAPAMVPRLFEPFAQGNPTLDRGNGGLGLGLALVKGLVELHGGAVAAASEGLGRGAAFTIRLPLKSLPAGESSPGELRPGRPEARGRGCRVLVVEDNVDAAESLAEALRFLGHEVEVALSGPDGVECALALRPDVVLCDIGLPEMDGYEVARALRARPELASLRLVALTGYAMPDDVARARIAGFDGHLAKPPSIEALERVLPRR